MLSIWPKKKKNFSLCEESGLHVNVSSALLAPDHVVVLACSCESIAPWMSAAVTPPQGSL